MQSAGRGAVSSVCPSQLRYQLVADLGQLLDLLVLEEKQPLRTPVAAPLLVPNSPRYSWHKDLQQHTAQHQRTPRHPNSTTEAQSNPAQPTEAEGHVTFCCRALSRDSTFICSLRSPACSAALSALAFVRTWAISSLALGGFGEKGAVVTWLGTARSPAMRCQTVLHQHSPAPACPHASGVPQQLLSSTSEPLHGLHLHINPKLWVWCCTRPKNRLEGTYPPPPPPPPPACTLHSPQLWLLLV